MVARQQMPDAVAVSNGQNTHDEVAQAGETPSGSKQRGPKTKTRGRLEDSVDVRLSKTLSYILRHGALKEHLQIRSDGCIRLDELLQRPKLKGFTREDIYRVVAENEKQRFALVEEKEADGTPVVFIRANQGHTLKQVEQPDLTPVESASELPIAVHGTYQKFWESIALGGLKPMQRRHIHLAKGLIGEEGVVSGMRATCDVFIYLDVEKCFQDNIKFFISSNGVILTEGLPDSKSVPIGYFKKVIDKNGNLIHPSSPSN